MTDDGIITPYTARAIWGASVNPWTEHGEKVPDVVAYNIARRMYYQQVRLGDGRWEFDIDYSNRKCRAVLRQGRLIFTRHDGAPTQQPDGTWYAEEGGGLVRKYTRAEIYH